jgi:predicted metal-dependent phosphoesterase TrpH
LLAEAVFGIMMISDNSTQAQDPVSMAVDTPQRILFERPNLPELKQQQYAVVDMHFHSELSDGHATVEAIARRAAELGIGIAVTDHNCIHGAVEIDRFKEVFSIPGIELTSYEGTHLLVYFYDIKSLLRFYSRDVQPFIGAEVMSSLSLEMEELIERARQYESVIIFPHPYCGTYTGVHNPYFTNGRFDQILALADGVEVINSENLNKFNLKSALLGFNLNKAITGGSDGHRLVQMGRVVTVASCAWRRRSFLDAVRRRRTRVIGKEIDILRKMTSSGAKLRSSMRHYPDLVQKNLRYLNTTSRAIRDNVRRSLNERLRDHRQRGGRA